MPRSQSMLLLNPWPAGRLRTLAEEKGMGVGQLMDGLIVEGTVSWDRPGVLGLVGLISDGGWDAQDVDRIVYGLDENDH